MDRGTNGGVAPDHRFAARSTDSMQRARQLLVDQICSLTGGPCFYTGRDMKSSHAGLRISGTEWDISIEYTKTALKRQNIGEREKQEVLKIFQGFRREIVKVGGVEAYS